MSEPKSVKEETLQKTTKKQKNKQGKLVPCLLIGISVLFFLVMLVFPLVEVIYRSLRDGFTAYKNAITASNTLSALQVTLIATIIAVVVNTLFGLCAAWLLTKFEFRGKQVLSTRPRLPCHRHLR